MTFNYNYLYIGIIVFNVSAKASLLRNIASAILFFTAENVRVTFFIINSTLCFRYTRRRSKDLSIYLKMKSVRTASPVKKKFGQVHWCVLPTKNPSTKFLFYGKWFFDNWYQQKFTKQLINCSGYYTCIYHSQSDAEEMADSSDWMISSICSAAFSWFSFRTGI